MLDMYFWVIYLLILQLDYSDTPICLLSCLCVVHSLLLWYAIVILFPSFFLHLTTLNIIPLMVGGRSHE